MMAFSFKNFHLCEKFCDLVNCWSSVVLFQKHHCLSSNELIFNLNAFLSIFFQNWYHLIRPSTIILKDLILVK